MILKKKNPKSSPNSFFQVTEIDGWCCGDKAKAIVCKYSAQLDASLTASGIKVDDTDYFFPTPLDVNSPQGREEFQKAFRRIVNDLGYIPEDLVMVDLGTGKLNVYTDFAQLHFVEFIQFDYSDASTVRIEAVKTDCKIVGLPKADLCDVEWVVRTALAQGETEIFNVLIRPVNIIPGAIYTVFAYNLGPTDNALTIYSGGLEDGISEAEFKDGNHDIIVENGVIKFHVVASDYTGDQDLKLSVQLPDGSKCCGVEDTYLSWGFDTIPLSFTENPDVFNPGNLRDKFGNKVEIYNQPKIQTV